MNYQKFIARLIAKNQLTTPKVAEDLAKLLDHETFQIKTGKESWIDARESLFDAMCAFLSEQGVPLPPVEEAVWKSHLPREANSYDKKYERFSFADAAKAARQAARGKRTKAAKTARGIAEFLELFDDRNKGYGFGEVPIIAALNQLLEDLGTGPIRPDYSKIETKNSADEMAPSKSVRILIIDDETSSIANSAIVLAGWPNVEIDFLLVKISSEEKSTATKEELLAKIAKSAADRHPQIVLMDQGLCAGFEGHELIPAIRVQTKNSISFVGNTGGSDDRLRSAGAYSNFEKGRDKRGMRQAVSNI